MLTLTIKIDEDNGESKVHCEGDSSVMEVAWLIALLEEIKMDFIDKIRQDKSESGEKVSSFKTYTKDGTEGGRRLK